MHRNHALLLVILALGVVILACGNGNAAEETAQALSEAISETAGASAGEASPEPGGESLTAQAKATEQAAIAEETAQASEALSEEAKAATATAVAPIKAELSFYGVDKDKGRVAWIHPPVTLDAKGTNNRTTPTSSKGWWRAISSFLRISPGTRITALPDVGICSARMGTRMTPANTWPSSAAVAMVTWFF